MVFSIGCSFNKGPEAANRKHHNWLLLEKDCLLGNELEFLFN